MLRIRRYEPQDNETVKALHFAGLDQFGAELVKPREVQGFDGFIILRFITSYA